MGLATLTLIEPVIPKTIKTTTNWKLDVMFHFCFRRLKYKKFLFE